MTDTAGLQLMQSSRPARPRSALPQLLRSPLAAAGVGLMVIFALTALLATVLPLPSPLSQVLSLRLKPPSGAHLLGTDQLGRDILSRLVFGARISLRVGVTVVLLSGIVGTVVGLLAGYLRGTVDEILMRITDVFFAFPPLILAMAIAGALGPSLTNTMVAVAAVTWPVYARLVRASGAFPARARSSSWRRSAWACPRGASSSGTYCPIRWRPCWSRQVLTWATPFSPSPV